MAGAGYKLFNSGDVLTAAQVNEYLMQQTVMVFNDAAARTTALSGVVAEGMISYLKDTNAVEVYNGSAWVASDDPNAIQNTIVDAKGDLITATAADTPARLASSGVNGDVLTVDTSTATGLKWAAAAGSSPLTTKGDLYTYSTTNARLGVGANGETLVADSGTTTGLRWQGNFAAGKNAIINGDCRINQRGFTSTTTSGIFGVDRWTSVFSGGTNTFSVQTFTPGTAPVSGYEAINFLRLATSGQSAAGNYSIINYRVEDVRTFAGQTATLSFWAKASSGTPSVAVNIVQGFGSGGSSGVYNYPTTRKLSITTSWVRYSFTVSMASIAGKTIGADSLLNIYIWTSAGSNFNTETDSMGIQSATIDVWGLQLEAGSVATPFTTATGSLQGELAACQRYYYVLADGNTQSFGTCAYYSATDVLGTVFYPVTMRTAPTFSAAAGSYYEVVRNSAADGLTGLQANFLTTRTANVFAGSGEGASGTAGDAGQYRTTSASANIAFSAEL